MDTKKFKEKAEKMLTEFDGIIKENKDVFEMSPYIEYDDFVREFCHMVHAFDKDMPLNNEINKENAMEISLPSFHGEEEFKKDVSRVRKYIEFFIQYITNYCE